MEKSKTANYMRYNGELQESVDKEGKCCYLVVRNTNPVLQRVCSGMIPHLDFMPTSTIFENIRGAVELYIYHNFTSTLKMVPKTHTGTLKYLDSLKAAALEPLIIKTGIKEEDETWAEKVDNDWRNVLRAYCYNKQLEMEGLGEHLSAY
ncbi:hypothetical protein KAR91_61600 [Candidatus Pacearchaeota archaeon]|nr:hypothetical protein [Candidatus Pacearchaeota archaeon]